MKTTKADYELFKKYCLKWQQKFGLAKWKLYFTHEKKDGVQATTAADTASHKATITLSMNWGRMEVTKTELENSACHEMIHLLLWQLAAWAQDYTASSIVDKEEHIVINHLLQILLK